jgi:RimJ/RimL family protein N-acetyltransferase
MCADPEVMRYVGEHGVMNREDAWRQLAMFAGHWQLRGFGMWAVEELGTGAFVGRVGLHYPEGWPDREVAWALAWPRVISLIDPGNTRSVRLAQRLGERLEGEATIRGHHVAIYGLARSAWQAC